MPKRNAEEKIEHYKNKIKRLEEKRKKKRIRCLSSSSSEQDQNPSEAEVRAASTDSEPDAQTIEIPTATLNDSPEVTTVFADLPNAGNIPTLNEAVPDLDPNILAALGESTNELPEFGENIHESLAKIWSPLLKKGMTKEKREVLLKNYLIPENCSLLQAPILNPEVLAAIPESGKFRDKKMTSAQQQLGVGITAINRGLNVLISDDNKVEAIKSISDGCRILSDLHYQNSEARIKFIVPCLDKSFLQFIERSERDNTLFGSNLSDKIKASQAITKQGQQIKKTMPVPKPLSSSSNAHPAATRSSYQGNWQGPSRYQSNRGGRGGYKRNTNRAPPAPSQSKSSQSSHKSRASTRRH